MRRRPAMTARVGRVLPAPYSKSWPTISSSQRLKRGEIAMILVIVQWVKLVHLQKAVVEIQ